MPRLNPAEYVIRTIGGVRKTARAIGRQPSTISSWRKARGTGGQIPREAMKPILAYANAKRLDITPTDLICGRVVTTSKPKTR